MNETERDLETEAKRLLDYLRSLKEDRGAMADLRCALSPARRARAWPLLGRVGGIGDPRKETLAGLFAWHPQETQGGNLGTTCRQLATGRPTFDHRFQRLLSCDRNEICERLRPIILAAKPAGIPINYQQLFIDLFYWGGRVKERWGREYWGVPEPDEPTAIAVLEMAP